MDKNKELVKNTFIIFLGKFCTQFVSFLLIPIYTKLLTTSDYGYVDLIQTYISLLVPIIILRFDSALFRFLIDFRGENEKKESIISSAIILLVLQIFIFLILSLIIQSFWDIKYIYLIIINIIFMAFSNICLQITRGLGDNIGYSIASIIAGISTIILNIIFIIILKMDGRGILIASGLSNIICALFLILKNKLLKYFNIYNIRMKELREMLAYSLPMIPDGLSWWIINVSDRSIISFILGSSANGIYAVSSKFSNILSSIFQVFNMSWQESASLHIDDEDSEAFFSDIFDKTYKIFYSICIIIIASIGLVFTFFVGEEYKYAYNYIPPLILGNLFNAMANVIGGIYIAKKDTKNVAQSTMMSALINICINIIFIRKFGLWATTMSTLISYIILTIYRYFNVKKYVRIEVNYKQLVMTQIIFIIISFLYYYNHVMISLLNVLISVIIALIINKEMIKKIYIKIKFKYVRGENNEKDINIWNV